MIIQKKFAKSIASSKKLDVSLTENINKSIDSIYIVLSLF